MASVLLTEAEIQRLLKDIFRSETAKRRDPAVGPLILPPDADLRDPRYGLDSIAVMEVASAVNELFHLHKTGLEDNLLRFGSLQRWVATVSVSWRTHPETITFRTSGSTGEPKACAHSMADLIQEVDELVMLFPDRKRIVSMVPCHHIYGFLFTVLLSHRAEIPVVEGRDMGIGQLSAVLEPGDLIVSYPLNWAYLARSLPSWPPGIQGVSSTGPISERLVRTLRNQGIERITEVYGASECSGVGYRHDPGDPFRLFSYGNRPDNAPDRGHEIVRKLPGGGERRISLPDMLKWEGDAAFRPVGRRDGAVQVGGVNVFPALVSETIRRHPMVRDCAVRLMQGVENPRLKAFVVPKDGLPPQRVRESLHPWLMENLAPPERPTHLTFGDELPETEMGKSSDWPVLAAEGHE